MEFPRLSRIASRAASNYWRSGLHYIAGPIIAAFLALVAFYSSLIATSAPLSSDERVTIDRAIKLLETKGFKSEALMLRRTATFRRTDNWLNSISEKENAFAATNFPFQIITTYPDFYLRASDDTERAMILLHEARHLMAANEAEAQRYVWSHKSQLGWTQLTHGTTQTFVTVEQQAREALPDMFTCSNRNWNDCTEAVRARK